MTYNEALSMAEGSKVKFGSHPSPWTFVKHNKSQDTFVFSYPNGLFNKIIAIPVNQLKNIVLE